MPAVERWVAVKWCARARSPSQTANSFDSFTKVDEKHSCVVLDSAAGAAWESIP